MIFLSKKSWEMIKEKYKQLCIAHQFGGINTIEYTQTMCSIYREGVQQWKNLNTVTWETQL